MNLRVPFIYDSNIGSYWGGPWLGGDPITLKGRQLGSDSAAMHVRDAEERSEMTAVGDPTVEAEEAEVSATFQDEYDTNVAALESKFEVF